MNFIKNKTKYFAAFSLVFALITLLVVGCQKENTAEHQQTELEIYKESNSTKVYDIQKEPQSKEEQKMKMSLSELIKGTATDNGSNSKSITCGSYSYAVGPGGACTIIQADPNGQRKCEGCGVGICTWFYGYQAFFYDCNNVYLGAGTYWCESQDACEPSCARTGKNSDDIELNQKISLFISEELGQSAKKIISIYVKHEKEINEILNSDAPQYHKTQIAFDNLRRTTENLVKEGFDNSYNTVINEKHVISAQEFLNELQKVVNSSELRTTINDIKVKLNSMTGKELKEALKSFDQ